MSRYFFHLQDGAFFPDRDGMELASIEEARLKALSLSAEILARESEKFWDGEEWQITATDHDGETLFTLNFYASIPPG